MRLPMVCVPVREFRDGGYGFLTADTAAAVDGGDAAAARPAIVGFADRGDAQQVQWLWDCWPQTEDGANRCALDVFWGIRRAVSNGYSIVCMCFGDVHRPGLPSDAFSTLRGDCGTVSIWLYLRHIWLEKVCERHVSVRLECVILYLRSTCKCDECLPWVQL